MNILHDKNILSDWAIPVYQYTGMIPVMITDTGIPPLSTDTGIYPGAKRRVLAPRTYVPPLGREFVDSDGELCF